MAIFIQNRIADDSNKKNILNTVELEPTDFDDTRYSFNFTQTFNFTLQELWKTYSEEELIETYLFLVFFFF